jgi:hypothetical protein
MKRPLTAMQMQLAACACCSTVVSQDDVREGLQRIDGRRNRIAFGLTGHLKTFCPQESPPVSARACA